MDKATAEYIVARGHNARLLLENPTFAAVVDDLTQYHLAALVAAPPGPSGKEAVDYHHLMQYAMTELVSTLQGHQQAGEEQLSMLIEQDPEGYNDDRS